MARPRQLSDLQSQFDKADAEHTANCVRVQESANRRELLRKALEDAQAEPVEPVIDESPEQPASGE